MEKFIFYAVHFCIFVKGIDALKGITRYQKSKNISGSKRSKIKKLKNSGDFESALKRGQHER